MRNSPLENIKVTNSANSSEMGRLKDNCRKETPFKDVLAHERLHKEIINLPENLKKK